jgi:hypothetical protein
MSDVTLVSLMNLAAIGLGGLAVYKMLTVVLGKPSETIVQPIGFSENFFLDKSDSFDYYWDLWTRRENRLKLKGTTLQFRRMEGIGPGSWAVRFSNFPKYFLIDEETKNSLIANAKLYDYSFIE